MSFVQILSLLLLLFISKANSDPTHKPPSENFETVYKTLFKQKHAEILTVVKNIVAMDNYAKQYKMIKIALEKMIQILIKSKVVVEGVGYFPGDEIPSSETVKDALALIVENTVLFGEILLRMPDITHLLLENNKEGVLIIQWSVGFCRHSNLMDSPAYKLLHLVAQELGLVEKEPNYINPYRVSEQAANKASLSEDTPPPIKQKKKSTKPKGPRLSGSRHTEL